MNSSTKLVIWQIHDEKPGHRNQLRGLTNALSDLCQAEIHELRAPSKAVSMAALFAGRFPWGRHLPQPDLVIGAGHATHFAVLAARRACGGKSIVLMKPSLPIRMFDLCIVPAHDQVAPATNVLHTRGVLNAVRPSSQQDARSGLLLIGGPSSAYGWSNSQVIEQLEKIVDQRPEVTWDLTTSRRTPHSFLGALASRQLDKVVAVPHDATSPAWVPDRLAQASEVWVSEDSVSMVYEALTSGAAVGILDVPNTRVGRVTAGVNALVESGWVTRCSNWQSRRGNKISRPPEQLDESRRCAEIILQRFVRRLAA